MRGRHLLYCMDYHHGQATRVVMAGLPFVPGADMAARQAFFRQHLDWVRGVVCAEPRGHTNMLGAVVLPPVRPDAHAGVIFLHPGGYFDMCGDSAFSTVTALVDSGMVPPRKGEFAVKLDTVAGPVDARVRVTGGEVVEVTIANVPSYYLGPVELRAGSLAVGAEVAYGGLVYAFVDAGAVDLAPLDRQPRARLLQTGTALWEAARTLAVKGRRVDLVTVGERLPGSARFRVANFYAPATMGRTPSGTGISARVALLLARGELGEKGEVVHESILGLSFRARAREIRPGGEVVPEVTARSYLMGITQLVVKEDDPFPAGFEL
ncbi:MAG: proline racemase family protein [Bacillota bacterium]|nr:proline racemase family protein [Bacillota bacterium]